MGDACTLAHTKPNTKTTSNFPSDAAKWTANHIRTWLQTKFPQQHQQVFELFQLNGICDGAILQHLSQVHLEEMGIHAQMAQQIVEQLELFNNTNSTNDTIFNFYSVQQRKNKQDEDLLLAQALQAEEDACLPSPNTTMKTELASLNLVEILKPKSCPICMDEHDFEDLHELFACGHNFCRNCIQMHCKTSISEKRMPIKCPSCTASIVEKDLNVLLEQHYLDRYHTTSLERAIESNPNQFIYCLNRFAN